MGTTKNSPGCGCCGGFVSECPNEDTTPFEGLSITGIPTTLTLGPFTIPDFNGTYLLTASDVCAPDAGDVPLPLFGIPTDTDCCTYQWQAGETQEELMDDISCFNYEMTNVKLSCTWGLFLTAQYADADTIEYGLDITVRVSLKADVYDNLLFLNLGTQTSHCMAINEFSGSKLSDNVAGLIVNPETLDLIADGDGEYTCATAFFCEVEEQTGTSNWAALDEWEITLEWV